MKIYVLFGHRKELYEGQYGVEALGVMSEYDNDENPNWLSEKEEYYYNSYEFSALKIIPVEIDEDKLMHLLYGTEPLEGKIK